MVRQKVFTDEKKKFAVQLAKFGFYNNVICDILEIDDNTFYREQKNDPAFRDDIKLALAGSLVFAMGKLVQNIENGNQRAIEYYLNNRFRKYFGDSAIDSGKDDEPEPGAFLAALDSPKEPSYTNPLSPNNREVPSSNERKAKRKDGNRKKVSGANGKNRK